MVKKVSFVIFCAFKLQANFSLAKNEQQKRRRPISDNEVFDSDGNYIDQIASDSVAEPGNFYINSHSGPPNGERRKLPTRKPQQEKVHYVTPEPHTNFPQEYVESALKEHEKLNEKKPANSFFEYSAVNHEDSKRIIAQPTRTRKPTKDYEDYSFYLPDIKRLKTKTTAKPSIKDQSEKYYKPQSADAIIRKEVNANGDDSINNYHYYYPSEDLSIFDNGQNQQFQYQQISSSTAAPSVEKPSKLKHSSKTKIQPGYSSTDPYQYQPVLQKPSSYDTPTDDSFYPSYPSYDVKVLESISTPSPSSSPSIRIQKPTGPSTHASIRLVKPTKKNNYYLPSSTMSPSTTMKNIIKKKRPSTEMPFESAKKISASPSPSTIFHYSTTTRTPPVQKYSTSLPISSTTASQEFYIRPSTQVTSSVAPSHSLDSSPERTVVIKPKSLYQNYEVTEKDQNIIYKFVPEINYVPARNAAENNSFQNTEASYLDTMQSSSPDYYQHLNRTTQDEMNFFNNFHKNYNYEFFTEQDASSHPGDILQADIPISEPEHFISNQASKKNLIISIPPRSDDYEMMPKQNLEEQEISHPMGEGELSPEASKNHQYFVLYSVDDDRKDIKARRRPKPVESEVVYHHHHHQNDEKSEDDFDSDFDTDLINSENIRIVDPLVRDGRPIEFTKDDYLRHIKQAVVQYMKNYQTEDSTENGSNVKIKNQRYYETEAPYRPTKASFYSSTYKPKLPAEQYKAMPSLNLPKNVYPAERLKDAIDEIQDHSAQVDLTHKKSKQRPFDLSAIDVGQTYQHLAPLDHSAALKNIEEFDQAHTVNQQNRQKLRFSQQTYHDINNLGKHQKLKQQSNDDIHGSSNVYKSYSLPSKYSSNKDSGVINYDSSKLPRIVSPNNEDDDDENENKADEPVDAPIQIINGIPVANPYNIDLNTLKLTELT